MPGTDHVWHTVTLTLTPDTDPQLAESRLMAAVDAVYQPYRERVEKRTPPSSAWSIGPCLLRNQPAGCASPATALSSSSAILPK